MKRVVVLGGLGLFGRTVVEQLRRLGLAPQTASRSGAADLRVDANDPASIRATLRVNDLVVDAAGPFHARSMALIETALELGFDVVDLNDDVTYAESVIELGTRISAKGIRVLSSASSVSAVSSAIVRQSGIASPRRVDYISRARQPPHGQRWHGLFAVAFGRSTGPRVFVMANCKAA